jgi:ABC-type amino acid transport substrate-binding protein
LKKYLSLLLVLMLSIGMLAVAGCGGEKEPSGQDAGQEPAITKLVVGSETAYAPFEMVDEKTGDYIGFDMDIIKAIGEAMGVEVEIRSMEFTALKRIVVYTEVIVMKEPRKTKKERKLEKQRQLEIDQNLALELEEKRARRRKIVNIIWKIWWIGLVIIFAIVFIQTYMIKFGS